MCCISCSVVSLLVVAPFVCNIQLISSGKQRVDTLLPFDFTPASSRSIASVPADVRREYEKRHDSLAAGVVSATDSPPSVPVRIQERTCLVEGEFTADEEIGTMSREEFLRRVVT